MKTLLNYPANKVERIEFVKNHFEVEGKLSGGRHVDYTTGCYTFIDCQTVQDDKNIYIFVNDIVVCRKKA